jgi:hypothetical protein
MSLITVALLPLTPRYCSPPLSPYPPRCLQYLRGMQANYLLLASWNPASILHVLATGTEWLASWPPHSLQQVCLILSGTFVAVQGQPQHVHSTTAGADQVELPKQAVVVGVEKEH